MAKLEIQIGNELHRVVYIEYRDGLPFDVKTIHFISTAEKPYWRLTDWDFFPNNGQPDDLRYYNSGSGGSHKSIQAPQWADGYTGKYWLHTDAKLKGKVKNGFRLKNPRRLTSYYQTNSKTSINPFLCAEETNSKEYCEVCGHESTEFCDEHMYEDSKGNSRYKEDDRFA